MLLESLNEHFQASQGEGGLTAFRKKGWQRFTEIGLPSKSVDAFRYVPLRELYSSSFKKTAPPNIDKSLLLKSILPECAHSHIVFIDGFFIPELSDISALPPSTLLTSFEDALATHGSFLQSYLTRALKEEKDPFALLNLALHSQGAFFYLPPKLETVAPLQCLYVMTGEGAQLIAPRLHLVLGAFSGMDCIFTTVQLGESSHLIIPDTQISLEEGASLNLYNILHTRAAWHFETLRAALKKNARFDSLNVNVGGKAVRHSYRVQLQGENSEANLNGLWMLEGSSTAHTHVLIEHEAPRTRSLQKFKGVLNDHSQSSFEGKIWVASEAQKTEAYQLNHNLLLSQGAIARAKPNLEIFADDVKASHGATISQLDDAQLFYLNTRGIEKSAAKELLIDGFCREMIEKIPYDVLLRKLVIT